MNIYRKMNDHMGIGIILCMLAWLDELQGRYNEARRGFEESVKIGREMDNLWLIGAVLPELAELDKLQGRYTDARRGFEESLKITREMDNRAGTGGSCPGEVRPIRRVNIRRPGANSKDRLA